MKGIIKKIIYCKLNLLEPVIRLFWHRPRISILMYHSIGDNGLFFAVTAADFDRQLAYLKKQGYRVIFLSQLVGRLTRRETIEDKTIALTFDDGYRDNYDMAWPILKKYDFPATIFMPTALMDGELGNSQGRPLPVMPVEQFKELAASGLVEFGSHTHSHSRLDKMSDTEFAKELAESKRILEDLTGRPIELFSYPRGYWRESFIPLLEREGFKAAVTVDEGLINSASLYKLKRNLIYSAGGFGDFKGKLGYAVGICAVVKNLFKSKI